MLVRHIGLIYELYDVYPLYLTTVNTSEQVWLMAYSLVHVVSATRSFHNFSCILDQSSHSLQHWYFSLSHRLGFRSASFIPSRPAYQGLRPRIVTVPCKCYLHCDRPAVWLIIRPGSWSQRLTRPDSPETAACPVDTRRWSNAGLMLARRLRRRTSIKPALAQYLVISRLPYADRLPI